VDDGDRADGDFKEVEVKMCSKCLAPFRETARVIVEGKPVPVEPKPEPAVEPKPAVTRPASKKLGW
jgi:hypothetical protein